MLPDRLLLQLYVAKPTCGQQQHQAGFSKPGSKQLALQLVLACCSSWCATEPISRAAGVAGSNRKIAVSTLRAIVGSRPADGGRECAETLAWPSARARVQEGQMGCLMIRESVPHSLTHPPSPIPQPHPHSHSHPNPAQPGPAAT